MPLFYRWIGFLNKFLCTTDETRGRCQYFPNPAKLRIFCICVSLCFSGGMGVNRLDLFLQKKVIEDLLCAEIFSSWDRNSHHLFFGGELIILFLDTSNIKFYLFFFDHDFILPCELIWSKESFLHSNFQLFGIELSDMSEVDKFLQF